MSICYVCRLKSIWKTYFHFSRRSDSEKKTRINYNDRKAKNCSSTPLLRLSSLNVEHSHAIVSYKLFYQFRMLQRDYKSNFFLIRRCYRYTRKSVPKKKNYIKRLPRRIVFGPSSHQCELLIEPISEEKTSRSIKAHNSCKRQFHICYQLSGGRERGGESVSNFKPVWCSMFMSQFKLN